MEDVAKGPGSTANGASDAGAAQIAARKAEGATPRGGRAAGVKPPRGKPMRVRALGAADVTDVTGVKGTPMRLRALGADDAVAAGGALGAHPSLAASNAPPELQPPPELACPANMDVLQLEGSARDRRWERCWTMGDQPAIDASRIVAASHGWGFSRWDSATQADGRTACQRKSRPNCPEEPIQPKPGYTAFTPSATLTLDLSLAPTDLALVRRRAAAPPPTGERVRSSRNWAGERCQMGNRRA